MDSQGGIRRVATSFRRLITVSRVDSLRKPASGKISKNSRNIESMKPILIGSV